MKVNNSGKCLSFLKLFEKFIRDTKSGKRLQANGKRISATTQRNYKYTLNIVKRFCIEKGFHLRIYPVQKLEQGELTRERNYWKYFYKRFTDYMYEDCDYFDNYAGHVIKHIRIFFNYLNKDLAIGVGEFHKLFYVRKEEIAIFPLMPEELNFFIYNKDFENCLSKRMKEVKDFFVFGCTVALRISDLLNLKNQNIRELDGQCYLSVRSIKSNTDTLIKLPLYAVDIISKYQKKKKLLPHFNICNLNKYIKRLLEQAGLTSAVQKIREKRGRAIEIKNPNGRAYRFCDMACTHTMRRTAITTMLSLGLPEQLVRKISGHSPASKEFYRYVLWAQTYQDEETEKMFQKLEYKSVTNSSTRTTLT